MLLGERMSQVDNREINELLAFWFAEEMRAYWFNSTQQLDESILNKFQGLWHRAVNGELDNWVNSAEGALALIILLDQMPLNMFRGQAKSFSTEAKAIEVTKLAINNGLDKHLNIMQRGFAYMPLMHSENSEDQALSVEQYTQLVEAGGPKESLNFAKHHQAIVAQFGRFPHRNQILGRESRSEELEYLSSEHAFTG